ncbi:hypothetical protein DSECCO2_627810 [anaerobic digester metagenome]
MLHEAVCQCECGLGLPAPGGILDDEEAGSPGRFVAGGGLLQGCRDRIFREKGCHPREGGDGGWQDTCCIDRRSRPRDGVTLPVLVKRYYILVISEYARIRSYPVAQYGQPGDQPRYAGKGFM